LIIRVPRISDESTYTEIEEIIHEVGNRKNYGKNIELKQLIEVKNGNDDLKNMGLGIIACSEEENDNVNRINKSREIEREFKEKKIQSVLLSNKETRKSVEEQTGIIRIFIVPILAMLVYVAIPTSLAAIGYTIADQAVNSNTDVANFVLAHYTYVYESCGIYNTVMLLAFLNRYFY